MSEPIFELYWSEEQRTELYRMMEKCDVLRIQLYAEENPTLEHWLDMTAPGKMDVWHAENWGMFYVHNFVGSTAMAHFCLWPEARKDAKTFCYAAREKAFILYPHVTAFFGITPAKYRHVFPVIKACGFELLGKIPGLVIVKGKPEDGVLSVIRRT